MRIHVRLFASLAESAGWRERTIDVPTGTTAGGLLGHLRGDDLTGLPERARVLFAVGGEHVGEERELTEGDEVALFPPVSGGAGPTRVVLTAERLDPSSLADLVRDPAHGALVVFEGIVRDHHEGRAVAALTYDCYEAMGLEVLERVRVEVEERWPGTRLALAHRTGRLVVGETSVVACCAAAHRRDAFAAARLAMDRIKETFPAWKREESPGGDERWHD